MGLFSRKKKVVKPDAAMRQRINKALYKQYPQMFTQNWADMLKGKVKKEFKTQRTLQIEKGLKRAGIGEKRIRQLRGKK